jgi:HEAT repeat protein
VIVSRRRGTVLAAAVLAVLLGGHPYAAEGATSSAGSETVDVAALLDELRVHASPEAGMEDKLAAVRTLAGVADDRALPLILDLAASIDAPLLASTSIRASVVGAIASHLARRGELTSFSLVLREAEPEVLPLIASAVARSGYEGYMPFLARLLGSSPEADEAVLEAIVAGATARPDVDGPGDVTLAAVRGYLESPVAGLRRTAAQAVACLHDSGAIPTLAGLLADGDARVVTSASAALRSLAGADHGADPERWREWYAAELLWWRDEAQAVTGRLTGDDPADAHKALGELLRHRLWRHELADAIGPLVRRSDHPIGGDACTALGQLGSRRAIPYLLDGVLADDPDRRAKAIDALRVLTGLDHGDDHLAWLDALGV